MSCREYSSPRERDRSWILGRDAVFGQETYCRQLRRRLPHRLTVDVTSPKVRLSARASAAGVRWRRPSASRAASISFGAEGGLVVGPHDGDLYMTRADQAAFLGEILVEREIRTLRLDSSCPEVCACRAALQLGLCWRTEAAFNRGSAARRSAPGLCPTSSIPLMRRPATGLGLRPQFLTAMP